MEPVKGFNINAPQGSVKPISVDLNHLLVNRAAHSLFSSLFKRDLDADLFFFFEIEESS